MTKTVKIILWIVIAVIVWLFAYGVAKVNAQQKIIEQQQPIVDAASKMAELDRLIELAQNNYDDALKEKEYCQKYRDWKMNEAHKKAEWYRQEIQELQGFILSR